jgi:hypothetical protein
VLRATTPEETPTTPITPKPFTYLARRPVHAVGAFGIIALCLFMVIISISSITQEIDETPRVSIPFKKQDEFDRKRAMLREAQLLYNAGAYDASLRHFEDYLRLYPWSPAARQGRHQAEAAVEAERLKAAPPVTKIAVLEEPPGRRKLRRASPAVTDMAAVTDTAAVPAQVAVVAQVEEDPNTVWQRVRRFFREIFIPRPADKAVATTTSSSSTDTAVVTTTTESSSQPTSTSNDSASPSSTSGR